ncbi:Imidazole glycerol phosphate synthase subunit HisF [Candidatus Hodgkinia cicadicola]|uniref:Imidazole glycerol phosphate synthase subunit HisF n=1 Tax=Candidatus Hodgkinia cicadicola TaxID=573658 RepID=A0ABX4MG60_9HYPH|nr:Imidazole glycerol phosphate synthase subunit HisF [Candidatus Hodgkinia cicadicola]PIM95369.1 Imidazole glycerol phosphate synthase subunit HisF [Candidatus Hodgkinia cicadicola]PIM95661.1 Imidazole glycerol phosphate synthase subunit HisF [Candidatus Hodgkinia cicadicola]
MTSLTIRIIPCIDVNYNNVVKGTMFSDMTTIGSPSLLANKYSVSGADELCLLNVTASSYNKMILYDTISRISDTCFIPLTVGGGIRTIKDVEYLLKAGADKVAINSASITNPEFVANCVERFGSQCIVSSVDCKTTNGTWEVFTHSGLRSTGIDALEHICKLVQYGVGEILLTSIDKDGTNDGYDIPLLKSVSQLVNVPVIASGGGSEFRHVVSAIVEGGVSAVLLASALHYDKYSVSQLKYFLGRCGILVRDDYLCYGLCD